MALFVKKVDNPFLGNSSSYFTNFVSALTKGGHAGLGFAKKVNDGRAPVAGEGFAKRLDPSSADSAA